MAPLPLFVEVMSTCNTYNYSSHLATMKRQAKGQSQDNEDDRTERQKNYILDNVIDY